MYKLKTTNEKERTSTLTIPINDYTTNPSKHNNCTQIFLQRLIFISLWFLVVTLLNTMIVQFSSVTQSCPTLCNPMNRSTPGLPVHHQLPEFTQSHVHRVSDAIQPPHPLSSPFPPTPISPSIRVFSNESTLRMRWPKYWRLGFNIGHSN